jgi:hypothetical protein
MVKVAIFHEGNSKKTHDNELLKLLLQELDLPYDRVKFVGMGSKSNFFNLDNANYKELLLDIKREAIAKVLFVVDADYVENDSVHGSYENCVNELTKIKEALGIEDICDIYITCDPETKDGYLESLILSSIPEKEKKCIEDFLDCSEFKSKENHKAILNQIYKLAYPNAPFDFSHPNFNELKLKLKNLFEGIQ